MAPPIAFGDDLLWIGSTGLTYSVPMYRIAGIYAPANGEFSTGAFDYPAGGTANCNINANFLSNLFIENAEMMENCP